MNTLCCHYHKVFGAETDKEGTALKYSTPSMLEKIGANAFYQHKFCTAANIFQQNLLQLTLEHGNFHPFCALGYYLYGLALMNTIPVPPDDDILAGVPKEADYYPLDYHCQNETAEDENQSGVKIQCGSNSKSGQCTEDNLELARGTLHKAWLIVKNLPDMKLKVDVLSALGEISIRNGECENSYTFYSEAVSILWRLVRSDSSRIIHLYFKICLSLTLGGFTATAINNCQTALNMASNRLEKLKLALTNPTGTEATLIDPYVPKYPGDCSSWRTILQTQMSNLEKEFRIFKKRLAQLLHLNVQPSISTPSKSKADSCGSVSGKKCFTQMGIVAQVTTGSEDDATAQRVGRKLSTDKVDVRSTVRDEYFLDLPDADDDFKKGWLHL